MNRLARVAKQIQGFLEGGSFPALAIAALVCWEALLIAILLIPSSPTPLGAFAEDFRVWCFGYDPSTGRMEWAYVMSMLTPQLMIVGVILALWWDPLRELMKRPRVAIAHAVIAALLVAGSATGFVLTASAPATGELPFPAEALRLQIGAPEVSLTNQLGDPVDLAALRGKVVVLTAIYASCGHTCPVILQQTKNSIAELDPTLLEDLRVVAVTMDPQNDSADVLSMLADNHDMQAPLYNLLTGPAPTVEQTLEMAPTFAVGSPQAPQAPERRRQPRAREVR